MASQEMIDKYVGKVFSTKFNGDLVVLEVMDDHLMCKVKFLNTGFVGMTYISSVKVGLVKDWLLPHFLGVGVVGKPLTKDISSSKAYKNWCRILIRCYSEAQRYKHLSYEGCTVSDYFLTFTNFEDWYYKQKNWDNPYFVLDKDLLCGKGSKNYSEDTCVFIPQEINSLLTTTKASRGLHPIGVSYSKNSKRYESRICRNNKEVFIGSFETPQEAFYTYKHLRESYLKEKALQWKDLIDPRAYEALMAWEINIDD